MPRHCSICCKEKLRGNQVSHSNIKTHRTWEPNLRTIRAIVNGVPKKIRVCSRCLRSGLAKRKA